MDHVEKFPFARDRDYPIADLYNFEIEVRQSSGRVPDWWKLWEEEVAPVASFVRHKILAEYSHFRILPSGHQIDVMLTNSVRPLNIQVTVADPVSSEENPGQEHALRMKHLGQQGFVSALGPVTNNRIRGESGPDRIEDTSSFYSREKSDLAVVRGIVRALDGKSNVDGGGNVLIVWVRGHVRGRDHRWFGDIVGRAISGMSIHPRPLTKNCFGYAADDLWV